MGPAAGRDFPVSEMSGHTMTNIKTAFVRPAPSTAEHIMNTKLTSLVLCSLFAQGHGGSRPTPPHNTP